MSGTAVTTICVLFDDYHPYFKGMQLGIARYARRHTNWSLVVSPMWQPWFDLELAGRNVRGLIGVARRLRGLEPLAAELPRVSITYRGDDGLRTVIPDHARVGVKVAEHLLDRGLMSFGSFMDASPDMVSAPRMHGAFEEAVTAAGGTVRRFTHGVRTAQAWTPSRQIEDLCEWLQTLPKPVGILASDDNHAWRAIEAAKRVGLRVPDDVAVVGVSNDEWFCSFGDPPISSATYNQEAVGYEAARVLHRMLSTGRLETGMTMVEPGEVVVRASSEVFAVADPLVSRALRFIWTEPEQDYKVASLLRHLHVSRSVLYRSFAAAGRASPAVELRRSRLARAKRLLLQGADSMTDIAAACGFEHVSQLSREIRRATGHSPTAWRVRGRAPRMDQVPWAGDLNADGLGH